MHEYEIGHAHHALTQNQNRRATRGDGILDGCQVSAGDSSSTVESEVDGGYVQIHGNVLPVSPTAVTHPDGASDPRRDVVLAQPAGDGTAEATVLEGNPGEWPTDDAGNQYRYANAWVPQPPDTTAVDGAVLAVVTVSDGATQSSGIEDIEDRRREPAPAPRQPWQQPNLTTPTVNLEESDFYAIPIGVPGDSWIHVWSIAQHRFADSDRVTWGSPPWSIELMEPNDSGADNSIRSTSAEYRAENPVWEVAVGGSSSDYYPYWVALRNDGGDMNVDEFWSAQLAVTIDRRPV